MSDHKEIWLEHPDEEGFDDRQWCQDKVFNNGTRYIRADIHEELQATIERVRGLPDEWRDHNKTTNNSEQLWYGAKRNCADQLEAAIKGDQEKME